MALATCSAVASGNLTHHTDGIVLISVSQPWLDTATVVPSLASTGGKLATAFRRVDKHRRTDSQSVGVHPCFVSSSPVSGLIAERDKPWGQPVEAATWKETGSAGSHFLIRFKAARGLDLRYALTDSAISDDSWNIAQIEQGNDISTYWKRSRWLARLAEQHGLQHQAG